MSDARRRLLAVLLPALLLVLCAVVPLTQRAARAAADPPGPVTGNATYFDALGSPYGGCGLPQANLDAPDFVALNVYATPGDYAFYPRPLTGADLSKAGLWNNGLNCGRYVQVEIGDYCTGTNDGAQNQAFCRGGSWVADAYDGARLTMIVADSCGDSNAWCRDDPYHLDLSKDSLNRFVKNGAPVGDLYPGHWNNRHVTWSFVPAPDYRGDIAIGFLQGAQVWWPAIAVSHLANGIHGVEYFADGAWHAARMNGDMGQSYVIGGITQGSDRFQIRVRDASDALINDGRVYSFGLPAGCGTRCGAAYTKADYTTSTTPTATPTVDVTPTVTPTGTPTGGTGVPCGVDYRVANAWQGGFTSNVTVRNTGAATWNNWTLTWRMPSGVTLTGAWSSTITTSGDTWTVRAPSWATSIPPGGSATFGFQANGSSTPGPTGIACS
ncbi:cellulose binding domain-containing protein [Actinomadura sp. ATCC 31491]|uniref:Cellulose binding domain-containing protein n=1 Tax=Actinomadura luzonensis TaxID=2805427 RepID=A0ABT0GBL6_9ACTN|nr:cellulose binding domain-containing protein [Actinomadura luzonensis]MCK2221987.1 cellulose binding domain-containing protein [Actinomadura luzonensis]